MSVAVKTPSLSVPRFRRNSRPETPLGKGGTGPWELALPTPLCFRQCRRSSPTTRVMLQSIVVVLFILFVPSVLSLPFCSSSRNVRRPRRILDSAFDSEHGRVDDPHRLFLKLDCPNCPLDGVVDSDKWNINDTTLVRSFQLRSTFTPDLCQIYDLIVSDKASEELQWNVERPQEPCIHAGLYPPEPLVGAIPFNPSVNFIGPSSLTVDKYLIGDANSTPLEVPVITETVSIPNRFNWNITRVSYINGLCFANGPDSTDLINIPVALVYLLHQANRKAEIVWWELQDVKDFRAETSDPRMPPLLDRRLSRGAWLQPQCDCTTLSDQMARWLLFGALVIALLIAGAIFESRVVQRGSRSSLCNCEQDKLGSSSGSDEESIDEELEERLERHP
ncbi:hypothetical protein IWX90DRAFT_307838 [Phyllosticta citrichinensis]|uniref:Transmembrane protein n=1 Tax=Phyllosticta citrichinensis TaxID=1130410 RepID=A0ABR1XM08_9PEZI